MAPIVLFDARCYSLSASSTTLRRGAPLEPTTYLADPQGPTTPRGQPNTHWLTAELEIQDGYFDVDNSS